MSPSSVPAVVAEIEANYSRYPGVMARVKCLMNCKNLWTRARKLTELVREIDSWEGPNFWR